MFNSNIKTNLQNNTSSLHADFGKAFKILENVRRKYEILGNSPNANLSKITLINDAGKSPIED